MAGQKHYYIIQVKKKYRSATITLSQEVLFFFLIFS